MKRTILMAVTSLVLLPDVTKGQWTFDIVSVETYVNDRKKQRSLSLARSTLEYNNRLLREYSRGETGKYKEVNVDLDCYTCTFDVIDVMYQSLRMVLDVKDTYSSVGDRTGDYRTVLEALHEKILKYGNIELSDALMLTIDEGVIQDTANKGEYLYESVSGPVLYAAGATTCLTSGLLMVLESVNKSLNSIEQHLGRAYTETWRYIQVRIDYWGSKIHRERIKWGIIDGVLGRWRNAGRLDYWR